MKKYFLKWQVLGLVFSILVLDVFSQTFVEQTGIVLPGVAYSSIDWGDYDNDSDLDVLITGWSYLNSDMISVICRNNGNNNFTEQILLTGVYFSSAKWGDYDNDGDLDILVTGSSYTGNISKIYRNNGNSTFTEQTDIVLTGVCNSSCAWGDYDNDGDLDILLTGASLTGSVSKIYQNNGNNTFTEQTTIRLPGVSYGSVAWGDYNNDNYIDILLTGLSSTNQRISKIFRNNGDNSFTEQTSIYLVGVFYSAAAWGDYDNDGDLDIVITGAPASGRVSLVYRNEGNNLFVQQYDIALIGMSNGSVAWGDCDNDGDLDILLSGNTGTENVSIVYMNNGDNTFKERTDISLTGSEGGSLAWGDYDSDNDLDILLTGNTGSEYISKIYMNSGLSPNIEPSAPTGLKASWENDHILFEWNRSSDDNTPDNAINYNLRIGRTSGGNQVRSSQALSGGKLLVSQLNSQNNNYLSLKLPMNRYYWSVQAVDNDVAGSIFATEQITPTDSIQAKDLHAMIKTSSSLLVRWTNGNGLRRVLFGRLSSISVKANPVNSTIYRAEPYFGNGDQIGTTGWFCLYNGKADSVVIYGLGEGYSYDLQVVEYIEASGLPVYFKTSGNGNPGVFSSSLYSEQTGIGLTELWTSSTVDWGDIDNDGYLDVINTGNTGSGTTLSKIFRNNGNNTFSEQTGISFPPNYLAYDIADYDNDSDLDILLINRDLIINQDFKIFRNNGNNTFTEQTAVTLGVDVSSVASGDYDNDGYIDILISGNTSAGPVSRIFKNNGDNTFSEQSSIILTGVYEGSVAWGDYNNDGYLDIVLTGRINSTQFVSKIFRNNGENSFTEQTGIYLPGVFSSSVAWGDYDNDNDIDLLITGSAFYYFVASIYSNNGDNTFTWQTGISLPVVNQCNVAWGDYNNDGYLDILMTGYSPSFGSISRIYRNNGNNSFSQLTGISLTGVSNNVGAWGDYDNDGDLDIMIGTKIYSNNTKMVAGSFAANVKPSAPLLLSSVPQPDGVRLSWTPVKSDETNFNALSYNIKIGSTPGGDNILAADADTTTGYRRIVALGNVQTGTSHIVKDLISGIYYWSVQAVDQGYQGGAWSFVESFEVKNVQPFYSADTVCLGYPTHFTDQSVVTDGIASWRWDFKDGTISYDQNPVHLYSVNGTYNVKLIITDNRGVTDSLEQNIIVKPRPSAGFTAPVTCEGIPVPFTNTTNYNDLIITSWYWNFGDGQISIVEQPESHGYLGPGNYPVLMKVLADNGCIDSITNTIVVASYPIAAVTSNAPLTFCKGDSVTLSVPYNIDYLYTWKVDGTSLTGADSSRFVARLTGNYTVEVVNSNGYCTTLSQQVSVTAQDAPAAPLISSGGPLQFCQGDSVTLIVTNTVGYTYQWKLNGGAVGLNSNKLTAKTEGTYNLILSNSTGCSVLSSNSVSVVVNNLPTSYSVALSGPATFCSGGSITLSIPLNSAYSYNWRNEDGLISGASTNSYLASTSGIYQLDISNSSGCVIRTTPVNVLVNPMPYKPVITSDNYQAGKCLGEEPIRFNVDQTVSGYNYQWYKNGIPISNATAYYLEGFLPEGDYSVEADLSGCKLLSDIKNVYFDDAPEKPYIYAQGPTVWYLACSNDSATTYKWYLNGTLIEGADQYLYVANQKLGKYVVSISNSKGCFTTSDTLKIPTGATGIEEVDPFAGLKIYPNPSTGMFTIEMDNQIFGELVIKIISHEGKQVLNIKSEKTTEHFLSQIDLSGQPEGIYFINLRIDKYLANRKIIVE